MHTHKLIIFKNITIISVRNMQKQIKQKNVKVLLSVLKRCLKLCVCCVIDMILVRHFFKPKNQKTNSDVGTCMYQ